MLDIREAIFTGKSALPIECEILDYKQGLDEICYGDTVKQVVSFHNAYGGYIVYGVTEEIKEKKFSITGITPSLIDIKKLRDLLVAYTGISIHVTMEEFSCYDTTVAILHVPKRSASQPIYFKKNGPNDSKNKPIFLRDNVTVRYGDNCITASSREHWNFLYSSRDIDTHFNILSDSNNNKKKLLENNLPARELICANFVGRNEELSRLWSWLGDSLSYLRLLAGEGGLGKTSIAYEFAEDLRQNSPENINQVIWLSAKKKKFIALENKFLSLPSVIFTNYQELLNQLAIHLGSLPNELVELHENEIIEEVIKNLETIPSFVIIDDIDSLEIEEQKKVLESTLLLTTRSRNRFLLTTRKNIFLSQYAIEISGLKDDEFKDFVSDWCARLQIRPLNKGELNQIYKTTLGSPLYTESLLRLLKLGLDLGTATKTWAGQQGSQVRQAALEREVDQLSDPAKKTLLAIAYLRECSFRELCVATAYPDDIVIDSVSELTSLFLVGAQKVTDEPRYEISNTTRMLVISKERDLVKDYEAIKKSVSKCSESSTVQKSNDKLIGRAVSQAMAQISADHKEDAFATIEAALKIKPHHPDLLLLKARCLHIYSKDEYKIKSLLSEAYKNGQRKEVIFDLWFDIEIDNNPADAVDVVSKAINCGFDTRKWRERKGVAIFRRAMSRNSKMHTEVLDDLLGSMRELKRALSKNPSFIDRKRIQNYTQQILEQLIVKISGTGFEINDRASFIDTLYAIRKEKISQDKTINDEARRQMEEIRKVFASKRSASRGEILLLNRLSDKVDEMQ